MILALDRAICSNSTVMAATALARNDDFSLYVTTYYCLEELFLSFTEIEKYGLCTHVRVLDELQTIRNSLHTNTSYFSKIDIHWFKDNYKDLFHYDYSDESKHREKFASGMLNLVTRESKGQRFYISKSVFGRCWFSNCQQYSDCIGCYLEKQKLTGLEKVHFFSDHISLGDKIVDKLV